VGGIEAGGGGLLDQTTRPPATSGWSSLCGLAALAALRSPRSLRARLAAALLAAGAFASASWAAVRYRRLLSQGVMGLEGRLDTTGWSAAYTIDPPELLPLFVLVAVSEALLATAYPVAWWPRRTERW
jgi:hypothetical protein